MTYYCSVADVGIRLGLDSAQRSRANSRIISCIRRASIKIDQCFLDYGRDEPSKATKSTTSNGAISAGATTITLTDASSFSTSGFNAAIARSKGDFSSLPSWNLAKSS